jgi:asparagine synthase (glutamine-hydrolysing)
MATAPTFNAAGHTQISRLLADFILSSGPIGDLRKMCGIVGIINKYLTKETLSTCAERMTSTLSHRGPDHGGIKVSADGLYALGHRRLSILDLSHASDQPIASPCGRYELVYNGEIYNFRELHKKFELKSEIYSDTQVLMEIISKIGLEKTLAKINGMFAFALVDREKNEIYLVRDRIGKKPIYYGNVEGQFVFASELKALKILPGFKGIISKNAVNLFLKYQNVPAPHSIYKDIWKLEPGCMATVPISSPERIQISKYWDLNSIAVSSEKLTREEWQPRLKELLSDSVKQRMISDVPLGAFLSGGIDSSLVVSLMQKHSDRPVKTFSIGTYDKNNEANDAKAIATHLGTEHTELYVSDLDAIKLVDELPYIWDEPFADPSQIPTLIVSQLAKREVTVALSGDGGDEFFAGYGRYPINLKRWRQAQSLPQVSKNIFRFFLNGFLGKTSGFIGDRVLRRDMHFYDKLNILAEMYESESIEKFYDYNISGWQANKRNLNQSYFLDAQPLDFNNNLSDMEKMMLADQLNYLPNGVLTKVDRASMHHSLEVRAPLLDYRVSQLAWQIPLEDKIKAGKGKLPLRNILNEYVPENLLDTPKRGFSVPIQQWLTSSLEEWADDLLDPIKMKDDGIFDYEYIHRYWQRVKKMGVRPAPKLWTILMFQAWLRNQ